MFTYEEFLRIAENSPERYEYIDGEIYLMTSPDINHQLIHAKIFNHLANDAFSSKNVVEPDILVSCDYNEQKDEKNRYTGIPALVIEILSPSTRSMDQVKKLNVYRNGGVREYWIVDPRYLQVTLYSFVEKQIAEVIPFKHPEVVRSIRFEGLEMPTSEFFSE